MILFLIYSLLKKASSLKTKWGHSFAASESTKAKPMVLQPYIYIQCYSESHHEDIFMNIYSSRKPKDLVCFLLPYTLNKGFVVCLAELLYFLAHTIITFNMW